MRVYIAGPIFTPGQRSDMDEICNVAESLDILEVRTFLPHRDGGVYGVTGFDPNAIYDLDYFEILRCDFVIACINGLEVDAGTAVEIGMAYALNKPVILFKNDSRDKIENLMIRRGTRVPVHRSHAELRKAIVELLHQK